MRIALIGYGAVAAIHARGLATAADASFAAVIGPDRGKAQAFADTHGAASAATGIDEVQDPLDAVIIASPSPLHFPQAEACLQRGLHVLIELPAVQSPDEARRLAALAASCGHIVRCATTSRFLRPYRMIGHWLQNGRLGTVLSLLHWRTIAPRRRSWTDDALLHHAAHPVDLLLHWFGALQPLGCAAEPQALGAQQLALLARLPEGAPVSMHIAYDGRLPSVGMTLVCERHMLVTDGFSFIRCDDPDLCWQGDEAGEYADAIGRQDLAFIATCRDGVDNQPWTETVRLAEHIQAFQRLALPLFTAPGASA